MPVAAEVAALESMSAHADSNEIFRWLRGFTTKPATTFLVHGEPGAMDTLAGRIRSELGWTVQTPAYSEKVEIN